MNKFNKTIGNFNIKLTNTMITITYKDQMIKAFDTKGSESLDKFNATFEKLEKLANKELQTA
tara:strand:- start:1619 stop:1804 length:186 start_codon:yes stop_codon:yes gene_type:complete